MVVQPAGESASSSCEAKGQTSGGANGNKSDLTAGRWFETTSHNENNATRYEVKITALDGAVHAWRYDEAMTRANTTLEDHYVDGAKTVTIRISGSFNASEPCTP